MWRWQENARFQAESLEKSRFPQFLLCWSQRWYRSKTQSFELSAAQSVDHDGRLTVLKHLDVRKSHSLWNLVSAPCSETGPNSRTLLIVDQNRIIWHFGFWEEKYREIEFRPLGNESSPFCRTAWFHIHIKMAFLHMSVWLTGQSGCKLCRRPEFDSWHFAAQAEKWLWAGTYKFLNFKAWLFNPLLKRTVWNRQNCYSNSFWRFGKSHAVIQDEGIGQGYIMRV